MGACGRRWPGRGLECWQVVHQASDSLASADRQPLVSALSRVLPPCQLAPVLRATAPAAVPALPVQDCRRARSPGLPSPSRTCRELDLGTADWVHASRATTWNWNTAIAGKWE